MLLHDYRAPKRANTSFHLVRKHKVQLLQYLWDYLRYRKRWDFVDQGLGIEARAHRCRKYWEPHLLSSMIFQREAFVGIPTASKIAILGAGRLYDVEVESLKLHRFDVHLYDADPLCQRTWQREQKEFSIVLHQHIVDLSGVLDSWEAKFIEHIRAGKFSADKSGSFLENLHVDVLDPVGIGDQKFELIVSLNLLGQIPIYWRDRVVKNLEKICKLRANENGQFGQPLDGAIDKSMLSLQNAHLQLLAKSGATSLVMICDRAFMYYHRDLSTWEEFPALYGDVEKQLSADWGEYKLERSDSWIWHIAPQGVEQEEHGIIHDIIAVEYKKKLQ